MPRNAHGMNLPFAVVQGGHIYASTETWIDAFVVAKSRLVHGPAEIVSPTGRREQVTRDIIDGETYVNLD